MLTIPQIVAIVIACVWLVALIVIGILSVIYQKKHNAYVKVREAYETKFHDLEKNANIDELLLPIKTNVKLPEDEDFYDIEHKVNLYITEKKKRVNKKRVTRRMKRKELLEDYNDFYGIVNTKEVYSLKKDKRKIKFPDLTGDLYVTNKRILLKAKGDHEEILLSDIRSCSETVVLVEGQFFPGFAIVTDYDIYQFINDDPTVIIIIRELMKRNKEI